MKINSDNLGEVAAEYSVSALPTFIVFRDGKVDEKVQGANAGKLKSIVEKLASESQSLGEGSGSSDSNWSGAELPRGYGDITDQIEIRNCEVLNADEDGGSVKALFESSKPKGFDKKSTAKDYVQSSADDQLLLFIPFQSTIKLHTLQVRNEFAPTRHSLTRVDHITAPRRRRCASTPRNCSSVHQPTPEHGLRRG